jgi:Na+/proline symporter/signal transduction histidine kinase/CheY-like chemotaxis protein
MPGATIFIVAGLYASLLFVLANWAKEKGKTSDISLFFSQRSRTIAYSLALAVYCTSWTFFGAVGTAFAEGWPYLPIYLGPILVFTFGIGFIERLIEAVKQEGATSISHFIGSRFSNSRGVAALVTLLALLGTVPYLALQLRSVGSSFIRLAGGNDATGPMALTAITLGVFAMLFGTRTYEVDSRNDGVLFAIAAESIVKLIAFVVIGVFAVFAFFQSPQINREFGINSMLANFSPSHINIDFFVLGFLASVAVICLPRQFYVGVIQATNADEARRARWPFVGYLLITTLVAFPIALASFAILPSGFRADLLVIDIALQKGQTFIALIVFLGGFSAATGMVIVETIALSTMVSNDLIAPFLMQNTRWSKNTNFGETMLMVRRIMIVVLMSVAFIYAMKIPAGERLASIGLIAFAAVAQFAPTLIMSVYGANQDATAAKAGLLSGLLVWAYTLLIPNILDDNVIAPLRGTIIDPNAILHIDGLSQISHGTIWSLGINLIVHATVAARRFSRTSLSLKWGKKVSVQQVTTIGDLIDLVARFVGREHAEAKLIKNTNNFINPFSQSIDRVTARVAERMIASVIGAPSARALMSSALLGSSISISDITQMLDHTGQSLQFSKDLLAATLEHIDPGVSVVDRNLNLVAWNSRYLDLFNYPPGMVRVGAPVADLIRYNALRGECGPGEVENHVERRLNHMRRRNRHSFERVREDGKVFKTVGGPMPDGGYVMCFTDITNEASARMALEKARTELEIRVGQRTAELSRANRALAQATVEKTRFLAAASHDLLQPLHAARLFSAALTRQVPDSNKDLLRKIDQSIEAGEKLLRRLLDISKLDAGGVVPQPREFSIKSKIEEVVEIFRPQASERGLELKFRGRDAFVNTDPTLLRSIVQNFMSNAIRYTKSGAILVGIRIQNNENVCVEVYDTGPGIPKAKQELIFREFERLESNEEGGIGLGLSIVERTARLLGGKINLKSIEKHGSRFSFTLPISRLTSSISATNIAIASDTKLISPPTKIDSTPIAAIISEKSSVKKNLSIQIVDDDSNVTEAMTLLIEQYGHIVKAHHKFRDAVNDTNNYDAYLLDYDLGAGANGFDLAHTIKAKNPNAKIAIITANRVDEFNSKLKYDDIKILRKPLAEAKLLKWLSQNFEFEQKKIDKKIPD